MRHARQVLSNFTSASFIFSLLLTAGYLVTFLFPTSKDYVVLVPGKAAFALWTCLTSSFIVVNPIELGVDIAAVVFVWKIVEPVYGVLELAKVMIFVAISTGITTFAIAYTSFVVGRVASALYMKISGFHGLLGALLVCFKQVAPDHQLLFCDVVRVRAQWLPSFYILFAMFIGLLYKPLNFYPFVLFGTYYAWFYLRFFQVDQNTRLKGDPSPSFSFASFFPDPIQGPVNKVAALFASIFQITTNLPNDAAILPISVRSDLGEDPTDQARRRERGQRVLDARLGVANGHRQREIPQIETQHDEQS